MKKIVSFLSVIIFFGQLFGQLYIGPIGGYHSNVILNQNNYGDSELEYKLGFGVEGGFMVGYQLNNTMGLQANLVYSQMGQKYDGELFDGKVEKEVKLNYVQIPLLFEWLPFEYSNSIYSTKPILYLLIGPQVSILNTTEYEYFKRNGENVGLPAGANSSSQLFNDIDVEVVFEPGIHLYLNNRIFLKGSGRAVLGITDINSERFQIPNREGTYGASRNLTLGLNVGVGLLLSN